METKVVIKRLRLMGRHGVNAQERSVGNMFEYDVEVNYPLVAAAISDNLMQTLNYVEVIDVIKAVNDDPAILIEHIAMRIRDALLARFPAIKGGCVRVTKVCPPIPSCEVDGIGIEIIW